MDGNLWAGPEVVKNDPNDCNGNGKMSRKFLQEHLYLSVVNSLDVCQGPLTRVRKLKNKTEMAVLDFFVVCEKIKSFIEKMIIDEDKQFPLSRYLKGGKKDSHHNTLIMYMEITFMEKKQDRIEMFNFKSLECQEEFFKLTEQKTELVKCFQKKILKNNLMHGLRL